MVSGLDKAFQINYENLTKKEKEYTINVVKAKHLKPYFHTDITKYIYLNDYDKTAVKNIQKNIKLNKVDKNNIHISNKDANLFLLESKGFDYIDLDPFGSPNPFLDSSIQRMSRNGILAVTATDTAALTGTYPSTTRWKYWATNYLCPEKHELALRILIRKIQLIGTQYERALIPLFSYTKEHYYSNY
jgi:tRNA (guanine26-N2/guanine27-N2)-dimethyltransferase